MSLKKIDPMIIELFTKICLGFLNKEQDDLKHAFYTACKDPSAPLQAEFLKYMNKEYPLLFENNLISSCTKEILEKESAQLRDHNMPKFVS